MPRFGFATEEDYAKAGAQSADRDWQEAASLRQENRAAAHDARSEDRESRMAESQALSDEVKKWEFEKQKALDANAAKMKIETDKQAIAANADLFKIDTASPDADVKLADWGAKYFRVLDEKTGDPRLLKQFQINQGRVQARQMLSAQAEERRTAAAEAAAGRSALQQDRLDQQKDFREQAATQKTEFERQRSLTDAQHALERSRDKLAVTQATSELKGAPLYDALETQNRNIESAVGRLKSLDPNHPDVTEEEQAIAARRKTNLVGKHDLLLNDLAAVNTPDNYLPNGTLPADKQAQFTGIVRQLNDVKTQLGYAPLDEKTGHAIAAPRMAGPPIVETPAQVAPVALPEPTPTQTQKKPLADIFGNQ